MDWYIAVLGSNFFRTAAGRGMCRCPKCKRCMDVQHDISRRQLRPNVIDAGYQCKCGEWVHGFYETPEMDQARAALHFVNAHGDDEQKATVEIEWQRLFERVQELVKENLAV